MLQDRFPGFQPSTGGSPVLAVQLKAPGARGRAVVSGGNHHPSSLLPHHVIISSPFGFFPFILIYAIPVWFSLHFSTISLPFSRYSPISLFFYFIFYHSSHLSPPFLGFSISQTPHHFSRCYDKPWLINSKASTPLRGIDYSDFQLPSTEVEYGLPAPRSCWQAGVPLARSHPTALPAPNAFLLVEQRL